MNYSKKSTSRKKKALKSKKTMMGKKIGVVFLKTLLVLMIALGVAGICGGIGIVKGVIENAPDITSASVLPRGYKSTVYDADGNKTAELVAEGTNRTYVKIENIPKHVQQAFIAIEDSRFYEHNGIDVRGMLRAGTRFITSGFKTTEGASTITQQLLKNNVFDFMSEDGLADKIERKLQEQFLAIRLEQVMTKDEILESYLNTINLGQNCLGVQAAANRYFGKSVSELSISEAAVLAAITKSPSALNPISHPEDNRERRQIVLEYMLEQGYISQTQYEDAVADDVYSRIEEHNEETTSTSNSVYSYFVDEVTDQVKNDLVEKAGYTETQAFNALYSSGLKIYTTQDPDIQAILDEEFSNPDNFPAGSKVSLEWALSVVTKDGETTNYSQEMLAKYFQQTDPDYGILYDTEEEAQAAVDAYVATLGITDDDTVYERCEFVIQPQASMIIMDQHTGEVKALVGGRGEKTANKTLNRATDTLRQPGSTFKIVAAYAPAFEYLGYGPGTVQYDGPFAYTDGGTQGRLVRNWDKNTQYRGWTTLREGITRSMNVMAVKTITDVTPTTAMDFLLKFGFTSLVQEGAQADYNQSMALGGLTNGVSNLELTAAYAAIGNGGTYIKPRLYTKVVDNDGNVILDNEPETTYVISEQNAWLLIDCMKDVITGAGGTGSAAKISGMTTAGKTGTTSDNNDVWFEGLTPYYTAGIWVGYDNSGYKQALSSAETSFHKKLWSTVMTRVHEGLENKDFDKPDGIVQKVICTKSGKLAVGGLCDSDGRSGIVKNEYFVSGKEPTEVCDKHVAVSICVDTGLLATSMCPNRVPQAKVLLPAMQNGVAEATTLDTAYGISANLQSATCTLHTGGVYVPSEYELGGNPAPAAEPAPEEQPAE